MKASILIHSRHVSFVWNPLTYWREEFLLNLLKEHFLGPNVEQSCTIFFEIGIIGEYSVARFC